MADGNKIMQSMYTKIIFGGLVAFIGIFGGIYVGNAVVSKEPLEPVKNYPQNSTQENELDARFVNFNPGDLFPLENFTTLDNESGNFEQLLKEKATILLFVSLTCGPCHDLIEFWKSKITDRLKDDVQVVVCIRKEDGKIPDEFTGLLEDFTVVRFDGSYWNLQYDMAFWPTIIAVDNSGFVQHVQLGFENYIEYQIADKYLKE